MTVRRAVVPTLVGACCACTAWAANLRSVEVSKEGGRYHLVADTHLAAPPDAVRQVLLDFDNDRYQRISEIYKESGYLRPDSDGTPIVYTRVEGCLLFFCRSLRRVERLEVATQNLIRTEALPDRSDFKYWCRNGTSTPKAAARGSGTGWSSSRASGCRRSSGRGS